jgi:ribosomal protein S18 acetylase RimI-like enzyme
MITLRPMTSAEFEAFKSKLIPEYARDIARNHDMSPDDATAFATRQIEGMLSAGLDTPRQRLYVIEHSTEGAIGSLWVDVDESKRRAFIAEIVIDESFRGRGHGRAALEALERIVQPLGIRQIELHVFGDNAPAIALYRRLGYRVTGLNMQKSLDGRS